MNFELQITDYISKLKQTISQIRINELDIALNVLLDTYKNKGNIYVFGNGGSGSTASHLASDFNKGVSEGLDNKFRVFCLNDNMPTILAVANDIGYDHIFEFQLKGKLKANDLVVGISGSGNSKNVILGVEYAKGLGVKTLSLTGYDGGILKKLTDYFLHVPIDNMQITEDLHIIFNHLMMTVLHDFLIDKEPI